MDQNDCLLEDIRPFTMLEDECPIDKQHTYKPLDSFFFSFSDKLTKDCIKREEKSLEYRKKTQKGERLKVQEKCNTPNLKNKTPNYIITLIQGSSLSAPCLAYTSAMDVATSDQGPGPTTLWCDIPQVPTMRIPTKHAGWNSHKQWLRKRVANHVKTKHII